MGTGDVFALTPFLALKPCLVHRELSGECRGTLIRCDLGMKELTH